MTFGSQEFIDLAQLDQEARSTACVELGERLEKIQEEHINQLCGPRYTRNNTSRYARGGSRQRGIITELGLVKIRLHKVYDKETGSWFAPLLGLLGLKDRQRYCPDVRQSCADLAVKVSYGDASETHQHAAGPTGISPSPARSSIHRFMQEAGSGMAQVNRVYVQDQAERLKRADGLVVLQADGTKVHSNTGKGRKNDARVVIAQGEDGSKILLSSCVNTPWEEVSGQVGGLDLPTERCVMVGDAEPAIRTSFRDCTAAYQLCILHVIRAVNFKLWRLSSSFSNSKRQMPSRTRLSLVRDLSSILFRLVGSVKKHLLAPNPARLRRRIAQVLKALDSYAAKLKEEGCVSAASFVSRSVQSMIVFARLALEHVRIPYTANMMERLMGEVAKRVKNRWAHWSEKGLNNLLTLLLVRYTNRNLYKSGWRNIYHPTENHTTNTIRGETES
jgi:hypothetical protein